MKIIERERFDYLLKIVMIGDTNVGKTNIISRLVNDEFLQNSKATIGVDFATKNFQIDGSSVKVQIWDTAGQERYHALVSAYYRGSSGAVVVYDTTNKSTLENVRTSWLKNLRAVCDEKIPLMLLGNKLDLCEDVDSGENAKRAVTEEEGRKMAFSEDMCFFETSALSGKNIQAAFESFVRKIYEHQKEKEAGSSKKVLDESKIRAQTLNEKKKKKGGCC